MGSGGISKKDQGSFLVLFDKIILAKGDIKSASKFVGINSRQYRRLRDDGFMSPNTGMLILSAYNKIRRN